MMRVSPLVALLWVGCTNSVIVEQSGGAGASTAVDDDDDDTPTVTTVTMPDDDCPPPSVSPGDTYTGWSTAFYLMSDPSLGNCSSVGCHGNEQMAADGVFLPIADQVRFYRGLIDHVDAAGQRYVDPDEPRQSWIHCHLRVPHAFFPSEHIPIIELWLGEGAPGP